MPDEQLAPKAGIGVISAAFPGTPEGVRCALGAVRAALTERDAGSEEAFSAELVVAEALNNVVEHALAGDCEPVFHLALDLSVQGVLVEIRDRGKAMPDGCPPLGELPGASRNLAEFPEGGYGWFLIRELARDLDYQRIAGENRLSFRIAIHLAEFA